MAETAVTLNQHALSDVACVEIVTEDDKRRYNDAIQRREIRMSSRHSK